MLNAEPEQEDCPQLEKQRQHERRGIEPRLDLQHEGFRRRREQGGLVGGPGMGGGPPGGAEDLPATPPEDVRPHERESVAAGDPRREAEARAERRVNRRLRRLLVGVGVVAIVAVAAGVLAFVQQQRAQDNADAADAARVAEWGYRLALVGTALMRSDDPAALVAAMRVAGSARIAA